MNAIRFLLATYYLLDLVEAVSGPIEARLALGLTAARKAGQVVDELRLAVQAGLGSLPQCEAKLRAPGVHRVLGSYSTSSVAVAINLGQQILDDAVTRSKLMLVPDCQEWRDAAEEQQHVMLVLLAISDRCGSFGEGVAELEATQAAIQGQMIDLGIAPLGPAISLATHAGEAENTAESSPRKRLCFDRDVELDRLVQEAEEQGVKRKWSYARDEFNAAHHDRRSQIAKGRAGRDVVRNAVRKIRTQETTAPPLEPPP